MCNVCEGDEIVYVNNQCAEDQFRGSIMLVINQANKKGMLEMKLRRYENKSKLICFFTSHPLQFNHLSGRVCQIIATDISIKICVNVRQWVV
jgi:hypothetical protein